MSESVEQPANCGTCKYHRHDVGDNLVCCRYPPTPTPNTGAYGWPVVKDGLWCGEYAYEGGEPPPPLGA